MLALLVLALGAVGCGGDDDDDGDSAEPATLTIEATSAAPAEFTAPDTAPGGAVTIEFTNSADEPVDGQLVRVDGERTDEEVLGELRNAMRSRAVADWFHGAGGAPETQPGETSTVTQVLEPGTYYLVPGDDAVGGELTQLTVEEDGGADLPETEARVIAREYEFEGEGLTAGAQQIELSNEGEEWHHFIAAELREDASIEDVRRFFQTEEGEPPFASRDNPIASTVMDGGVAQIVDVNLEPGRYAFLCFIADRAGGPPHAEQGMISEVTVDG